MSRSLQVPPPTTTLGLYRHLLRESSYLPSLARPHVDQQIKDRFRRHRGDKPDDERLPKRIKEAHHELRVFRAANAGDMTRMRGILLKAFGRTGSRRRELFSRLIRRPPPVTTEDLEAQISSARSWNFDRPFDWLDGWDTETLMSFAKAQAKASFSGSPRGPLLHKHLTPPEREVPRENAAGRPFPDKVIRTKIKKIYAELADREAGWYVPSRRPLARSLVVDDENKGEEWKWQLYATKPVALVDISQSKKRQLLTGASDENTPYGNAQPLKRHVYTARFWRRLIKSIWLLTATRTEDPEKGGYRVKWARAPFQAPTVAASGSEFFESLPADAEDHGKMGKKKKGRK
ncbi:hypothetical protein B0T21DRAFT_383876 [Apiosordaria backusii]|uniref:LYR motif-containing protein Cup1-like N-terminal domain-containing protein n=1 Tax=Apiosordaria backusii TaxID=314023 RepID=A0AA40BL85_9PEZI|nr:hypothetical protein B0T21DRAFT_383876 [Apiosordaria backusii]